MEICSFEQGRSGALTEKAGFELRRQLRAWGRSALEFPVHRRKPVWHDRLVRGGKGRVW